ncbi:MAG: chemotaxis protein CheW [Thermoanaerobaculia bacterium]|nr:chemotaxis protein CheW [Thermoanaerobaculia bacterium]
MAIEAVREIAEPRAIATVPSAPAWLRGVMNLRGSVVPVVDLSVKLGCGPTTESRRTCLVLVEIEVAGETSPMAVMVDAVRRVVDLDTEVQQPPAFGAGVAIDFISGTTRIGEQLVILLDMHKILGTGTIFDARQIMAGGVA